MIKALKLAAQKFINFEIDQETEARSSMERNCCLPKINESKLLLGMYS
jgi:hypothetical protein